MGGDDVHIMIHNQRLKSSMLVHPSIERASHARLLSVLLSLDGSTVGCCELDLGGRQGEVLGLMSMGNEQVGAVACMDERLDDTEGQFDVFKRKGKEEDAP